MIIFKSKAAKCLPYACDLSLFPVNPAANPSLTSVAPAIRLAEHLKTEFLVLNGIWDSKCLSALAEHKEGSHCRHCVVKLDHAKETHEELNISTIIHLV